MIQDLKQLVVFFFMLGLFLSITALPLLGVVWLANLAGL